MDDAQVISEYSLEQALKDGVLRFVFSHKVKRHPDGLYADGKYVVATAHLYHDMKQANLFDLWVEYLSWRYKVMPTLPEEEQMFVTERYGKKIWIIEDGQAYIMMYPEDY